MSLKAELETLSRLLDIAKEKVAILAELETMKYKLQTLNVERDNLVSQTM